MKHKVLLVDDHQLVLDGLKSIFSKNDTLEIMGTATSGKQALRFLETMKIDLVLTDINMPGMTGIELTKEIRLKEIDTKVLVLTMHNEKSIIKQIMQIGAEGYLLKTATQEEMQNAVNTILGGQKFFSSEVTMTLLAEDKVESVPNFDLTEREIEILQLIAEGFSNKEIGDKLFISHRTVDTHRTNMMKKLEVNNIAGLIRFAMKNNIIS